MASRREQIVLAVAAVLDGPGKPSGVRIHRERCRPLESDDLPAILVYCEDEAPERLGGRHSPLSERRLALKVQCRAKGEPADAVLDPLLTWAVQALLADESLGGLASGFQEGPTRWGSEEADDAYAFAEVLFTVTYRTSTADPESIS